VPVAVIHLPSPVRLAGAHRWLTLAIVVVIALAPLHSLPGLSPDVLRLAKQAMTLIVVAVWLAQRSSGALTRGKNNPVVAPLAAYVALLLISAVFSVDRSRAVQTAAADTVLLLLFLAIVDVSSYPQDRKILLAATMATLTLGAGATMILRTASVGPGTISQLALFSLPLPIAFAVVTAATRTAHPQLWIVSGLVAALFVVLFLHRGTLISVSVVTLVVAVQRWGIRPLLWVGAAVAAAVTAFLDPIASYLRFGAGLTGRPELWLAALGVFRDHPLVGTGPGTFPEVYQSYQPSLMTLPVIARPVGRLPHAHDIFLNALAELGVAGPLVVALLLGVLIWIAYQGWRVLPPKHPHKGLALGLLAAVLGTILQEVTESGTIFRDGSENIFFWTLAGIAVSLWQEATGVHVPGVQRKFSAASDHRLTSQT
jgi:putative inorganic carbon (hco3(-)) transporter